MKRVVSSLFSAIALLFTTYTAYPTSTKSITTATQKPSLPTAHDHSINHYLPTIYHDPFVFNLSDLIQGYLAEGKKVDALVHALQGNLQANPLSAMLAKKWIRNAAVRIFHDPLRSFLEIVVNACDSMLPPEQAVGKFGMGFFSIFSFLDHKETNGTVISIKTAYTTNSNTLCAYEITFAKNRHDDIVVSIIGIDPKLLNNQTGTIVTIKPIASDATFSDETLKRLAYFTHYLDYHPHVAVALDAAGFDWKEAQCSKNNIPRHTARVTLRPTHLEVRDRGTGISITTALTHLLIPSSSSKASRCDNHNKDKITERVVPIQQAQLVNFGGKAAALESHFLITINGVVVVDKKIEKTLQHHDKYTNAILLSLPQSARLTLGRNELMITEQTDTEAILIKNIITQTIEHELVHSTSSVQSTKLLEHLYSGLYEWERQSAAQSIKGLFTSHFTSELDRVINEHDYIIPVPLAYSQHLEAIIYSKKQPSTLRFIPLSSELAHYNFERLEAFLTTQVTSYHNTHALRDLVAVDASKGKLLSGVSIFFVKDNCLPLLSNGNAKISSLGLRTSLFVPESILTSAIAEAQKKDGSMKVNNELSKKLAESIAARIPDREYAAWHEESNASKTVITSISTQKRSQKIQKQSGYLVTPGYFLKTIGNDFKLFSEEDVPVLKVLFDKHYEFLADSFKLNSFSSKSNIVHGKTIITTTEFLDAMLSDYDGKTTYSSYLWNKLNLDGSMIYDATRNYFYTRNEFMLSSGKEFENIARKFEIIVQQHQRGTLNSQREKFAAAELLLTSFYIAGEMIICNLCDFINTLFGAHLIHYGVYSYNAKKYHGPGFVFLGTKQGLPLTSPITVKSLEDFLFTLLYHSYFERPQSTGLSYYWKDAENRLSKIQQLTHTQTGPVFFHIPGIQANKVPELIEQSLALDLTWADTITKTLNFSISNISVGKSMSELLSWNMLAQLDAHNQHSTPTFSTDQKLQLMKLKESLLGLYHSYLSIPDAAFKRTYGTQEPIVALHPQQDVSPADVINLLSIVASKPTLFKKLLGLQRDDFSFQTTSTVRTQDLQNNKLYMPTTLSNTPFSILATLRVKGLQPRALCLIIEKITSPEELAFVGYLLLQNKILQHIIAAFENNNSHIGDHLLTVIIERFIRERLDQARLRTIYQDNRCHENIEQRIATIGKECSSNLIYEYIISTLKETFFVNTTTTFIPDSIEHKLERAPSFTLSQLLQAHTSPLRQALKKAIDANNIDAINVIVQQQPGDIDLSKIRQSIEVGSEKMPLEGTMIEALQNSVDVVTSQIIKNAARRHSLLNARTEHLRHDVSWWKYLKQSFTSLIGSETTYVTTPEEIEQMALSIVYKTEIMSRHGTEHAKLTIRDHVGMENLETLLTDFIIPDYSQKSSAQGNIGDMGNGIFKMYQNADRVSVVTRLLKNSDRIYCLHITPIRSQIDGYVYDLSLRICDVSSQIPQTFYGTSIKILYQSQEHDKIVADLLFAKELLMSAIGCTKPISYTQTSGKSSYLSVNAEAVDGSLIKLTRDHISEKTLIYEYKEKGKALFTVYARTLPFQQSYLTTNGIPMGQLNAIAREMNLIPSLFIPLMSNGYIVDLALGTYQPVQSRSKLQMDETMLAKLRHALLESFFIIGLQRGMRDNQFFCNTISHFASTISTFDQLRLSASNAQKCEQSIKQFITCGTEASDLTLQSFFDFYKPLGACSDGKSFYRHLENCYQDDGFFSVLNQARKKAKAHAQATLKAWLDHPTQQADIDHIQTCNIAHERNNRIQKIYDNYHSKKNSLHAAWEKQRDALLNTWRKTTSNNLLTKAVVVPWVCKKVATMGLKLKDIDELLPKIPVLQSLEKNEREQKAEALWKKIDRAQADVIKNNLKRALNFMLEKFCSSFITTNKKQSLSAEFYYQRHDEKKGYFSPSENKIYINLRHISCIDQAKLFASIIYADIAAIKACHGYIELYAPKVGRTTTLIHELEHARRNNSHLAQDAHSDAIDKDGEPACFESCANSFANDKMQQGFLLAWIKSIREESSNKNHCYRTL